MRILLSILFSVVSLLSFAQLSQAGDGGIEIDNIWARPVFMAGRTGAAYFTLVNKGEDSDRLVAAKTTLSDRAELHQHVHDNGVMKMRQVEDVEVPAGEVVMFRPGGYHVMIFNVDRKLSEGDSFPLTLVFENAGAVEVTVQVMKQAPAMDQDHSGHH